MKKRKIAVCGIAIASVLGYAAIRNNEVRNIAVIIGEECDVLQTNAPVKRLENLESKMNECSIDDIACIPNWESELKNEGYKCESLDLKYFGLDEIRMVWLQNEYSCIETYKFQ